MLELPTSVEVEERQVMKELVSDGGGHSVLGCDGGLTTNSEGEEWGDITWKHIDTEKVVKGKTKGRWWGGY